MIDWLSTFPSSLPTPFVAIDEEIFRKNFERVLSYAEQHQLRCCPHFKAHKSLALAKLQLGYGCDHMCVAKADEGIILSELALKNIFCSCHPVGVARLKKLAAMAARVQVRVPVDCEYHVRALASASDTYGVTFQVMLDIDLGLGRTGIRQVETLESVLRQVFKHRSLSFSGVQLYLGNIWGEKAEDENTYIELNKRWLPFIEKIKGFGIDGFTVSIGSSPILFNSHRIEYVNEIRPGALLMGDYWLLNENACSLDQCAARIVTSIISAPEPGRSLIDAGTKAICGRSVWVGNDRGFARIDQHEDARLFKLHEEIGWINHPSAATGFQVGERLSLLPVLIGPTISQYRSLYLFNGDNVVEQAIEGSGALC